MTWCLVSGFMRSSTLMKHRSSATRARMMMSFSSSSIDGNTYMPELIVSLQATRRAAIAAKALQKTLLKNKSSAISKTDSSPVTIADFSVQALVVNEIRRHFPTDQVVAEENSGVLRQDPKALQAVTEIVSRERIDGPVSSDDVCTVLDHGRQGTCV